MSQEIKFYAVSSWEEKLQHICRSSERWVASGERVLIWTGNPEQTKHLDAGLWNYESTTFLPHAVWPCPLRVHPVILSWKPLQLPVPTHLIVAHPHDISSPALFSWMEQFKSVQEYADSSHPDLQQRSRQRFRAWKQHNGSPTFMKTEENSTA